MSEQRDYQRAWWCKRCAVKDGVLVTAPGAVAQPACPQCGGWQFTVNRCAHCRLDDLDYARTHSHAGRLFERLLELEFDAAHFSIPSTDVTAEEVRGLQVLKEERDRYQREQAQKQPHAFPN